MYETAALAYITISPSNTIELNFEADTDVDIVTSTFELQELIDDVIESASEEHPDMVPGELYIIANELEKFAHDLRMIADQIEDKEDQLLLSADGMHLEEQMEFEFECYARELDSDWINDQDVRG